MGEVGGSERSDRATSPDDRIARWAFGGFLAAALIYVQVQVPGAGWFAGDDWELLAKPNPLSLHTLFSDINGHWVLLPRLAFAGLWSIVGLNSYAPYKFLAVMSHGVVAVLLRTVMRRSGVRPWTATLVAGVFVLLGSGGENIVMGVQVALTASVAFGLVHLMLADTVGPIRRRDVAGLAAGLAGLLCSGFALPMTAAVGLLVLIKRGWKPALFHTVPIAAVYVAWLSVADPARVSRSTPSPSSVVRFIGEGQRALVTALAIEPFLVVVYGLVLVAGALLLLWPASGVPVTTSLLERLRAHALPISLWSASIVFNALLARNLESAGPSATWSSRYVYLGASVTLPLFALAGDAVARAVPKLAPALVAALLLPLPANVRLLQGIDLAPFDISHDADIMRTAIRFPFAREVDPGVRPIPDSAHLSVTIGFLLDAARNGKLRPTTSPITVEETGEYRVRLGLRVDSPSDAPTHVRSVAPCHVITLPARLAPAPGDRFSIAGRVGVVSMEPHGGKGTMVHIGDRQTVTVTVELAHLNLLVSGRGRVCSVA